MTAEDPDFLLTAHPEDGVLQVHFTGRSSNENAAAMTRRYFDLVLASSEKKILADIRELKGRLSEGQTYFLLRDLPVQPVPAGYRTAILEAEKNRAYAKFLEDTAANIGIEFKCFFDQAAALAWLHAAA